MVVETGTSSEPAVEDLELVAKCKMLVYLFA